MTDAVAATAVARRLGIPRPLIAQLEGESLLNDASALVLYSAAVTARCTPDARLSGGTLSAGATSSGSPSTGTSSAISRSLRPTWPPARNASRWASPP